MKDALHRVWHDVRIEGDTVDVHRTDRAGAAFNELVDGAARNMFKRTMSDPQRLRSEQAWQAVSKRAAASFAAQWTGD